MSAWVVEFEHIAAMVNAADRHSMHEHSQCDWSVYAEDGTRTRYTLSRTGENAIEEPQTVELAGGYVHTYPLHITVSRDVLGSMLLNENVRSVSYRYEEPSPN